MLTTIAPPAMPRGVLENTGYDTGEGVALDEQIQPIYLQDWKEIHSLPENGADANLQDNFAQVDLV